MICPRCQGELFEAVKQGVAIDHCSGCKGIWLDQGELAKIIARDIPVPVDTWDPVAPCSLPSRPAPMCRDYSHIIIANNDPAFTDMINPYTIEKGTVVIDLWRAFSNLADIPSIRYVALGRCRSDQMATVKLVKGIPGVY